MSADYDAQAARILALAARDAARAMSISEHRDDCPTITKGPPFHRGPRTPPACAGCISAAERALWKQQADEYDTYLRPHRRRTDGAE